MERDHRTLWKWDHREVRHVFCPRRNGLITCPLSNYCRWNVLLQLNNNWRASSFSIDESIRLVKAMMSRDFSSDASCCHRINLHDVSQEANHVTLLIHREIDLLRRDGSSYTECFQERYLAEEIMIRSDTDTIALCAIILMKHLRPSNKNWFIKSVCSVL